MKTLRRLAERTGLYNRLRYSRLYGWMLRYKNPAYIKALADDVAFYRAAVGDGLDLIFDVGANTGDKTWCFRKLANRVVCIEPDRHCTEILRARFSGNRSVTIEDVAIGESPGRATLCSVEGDWAYSTLSGRRKEWLGKTPRGSNVREYDVAVSTLDALIAKHGRPFFIKIDVEGFEVDVIRGLSQPVPVVCLEANLPEFLDETMQAIGLLSDLGASRFNLRGCDADTFMFSGHESREFVERALENAGQTTFDVFAYTAI
jgi:FkbM family methyltransferase